MTKVKIEWMLLVGVAAHLMSSCATRPPAEDNVALDKVILGAARALNVVNDEIKTHPEQYKTFGLRPSKATVSLDISSIREKGDKAEINVSAPASGGTIGGLLGWSVTTRTEKGSHVEIEFTPPGK